MAASPKKSERVSRTKSAGLTRIHVGRDSDNNVFVFYGKKKLDCRAVEPRGDNQSGGGDEVIKIDLSKVPARFKRLGIVVTS